MCPNVNFQIPICTTWYICNLKAHIYMVACCCVSACDVWNSNLDWSCHRKYHIRKVFPSACLHTTISKIECDWHWNHKFYIWGAFLLSVSALHVNFNFVKTTEMVTTKCTFIWSVSFSMWRFMLSQISHLQGWVFACGFSYSHYC